MDENNTTLQEQTSEEQIVAAAQLTEEEPKMPLKQKVLKEVREWIISLAVALLAVFLIHTFLFTIIRVDGGSMNNTLLNGERLFVTVPDAKFGTVERNEVVICYYPNRGRTNFVKRVVAVPGDQVYRENGLTHVIYEVVNEEGVTETVDETLDTIYSLSRSNPIYDYEPYTLGEDEYFVVGDNRYNSHDSRDWLNGDDSNDVGPITKDMIIGHVRYVIWPLDSIRPVE